MDLISCAALSTQHWADFSLHALTFTLEWTSHDINAPNRSRTDRPSEPSKITPTIFTSAIIDEQEEVSANEIQTGTLVWEDGVQKKAMAGSPGPLCRRTAGCYSGPLSQTEDIRGAIQRGHWYEILPENLLSLKSERDCLRWSVSNMEMSQIWGTMCERRIKDLPHRDILKPTTTSYQLSKKLMCVCLGGCCFKNI